MGAAHRRRVVLFVPRLHRGGAGKQVTYLATGLERRGWDVRPLTLLSPGEYARKLEQEGISVTSLGASRGMPDPRALLRCVRQLRRWKPDVVVAFLFHAILAARLSIPLAGNPPLISAVRNERFGGRAREIVQRLLRSLDDLATVNSPRVARRLIERGVLDADRLEVVPNAVDLSAYGGEPEPAIRRSLGIPPDAVLWLAVGDLHPQKGYDILLQAWSDVADALPAARLQIAGEGPLRSRLEHRIRELGIADTCGLLGHRSDVPSLLAAADAFVLASRWEGSPNAVAEAMAAGLPVVATRVGGVPELLGGDEAGRLVPAGNPGALAGLIAELTRAPAEERQRIGAAGRSRMEARHGLEPVLSRWEEVLERAMGGRCRG